MLAVALPDVDLVFSREMFTFWHVLALLWYADSF